MQPQVIICKDRAEWLEARKDGLGASDAAALLGLSPWKTNVQLWEEKCGLVIPEDIGDKPYVRYGNDAEPLLRSFFALDHPEYRVSFTPYTSPTGLYARGKLCVVDGTDFLYDGKVVGHVTAGEKQFATINTKIVIFPDKVYYDTEAEKFGMLAAEYPGFPGDVTFTANTLTVPEQSYIDQAAENAETKGSVAADTAITAYTGASVNKTTGALTMSGGTAGTPDKLKAGDYIQYDCDSSKEYMVVQSSAKQSDGTYQITYLLHTAALHKYPGFDELFKAGDAIEISGCTTCAANNGSHIIRSLEARKLTFTKDIFTKTGAEAGTVMLERKVPDLTCICECDNRIWGAEGKTIYASALGDPTNFYVYDGVSTDSYAVAVGTEGEFTGCIAYSSTVLFWKENCLHKVLGSYPAQYEIYTYTVPGIQKGSEKSLAVINETLFYKGRNGVYAYSGGTPELLTENFGTRRFFDAVGGTDGERYYISMRTEKGDWELYVFDTLRAIWLREDATHALDWAYPGRTDGHPECRRPGQADQGLRPQGAAGRLCKDVRHPGLQPDAGYVGPGPERGGGDRQHPAPV